MAAAPPLVDVRNLSVAFGDGANAVCVVKGVSFTIAKGETVALVGESGSGKTVSAMSILRLLPNSASHPTGEILFEGKDILKANEAELRAIRGRQISIIFQEPMTTLNPLHTIEVQVGEIIKLHQKISDEETRRRVIELLTKVGIRDPEKRLDSYPHQLVGRPAPARHDRHRARQRARSLDRRRADDRARRHDPGADPGAAEGPAKRDGHGDALDHA